MRLICFALACLTALPALARPVSYPGGWTTMQTNDSTMHALHVHYSPSPKHSIGYKAEYWRAEDWQFHGLQLNYLINRSNAPHSQGNLYLKSGAGLAYSDFRSFDHKIAPAAFTGIAGDWETRRVFTSYEARVTAADNIDHFFMQKARVGVAPYIGDYGDLHTWLMLEADHNPTREDELIVTPLVRLFKGDYLIEAGISHRGDVLFNNIIRF